MYVNVQSLVIDNPTAATAFSAINVPEPPKPREKAKAEEDAPKAADVSHSAVIYAPYYSHLSY